MATTRQFFYKINDSNSSVTVEISISNQPGVISLHLENTKIGNTEQDHFPETIIGSNKNLRYRTLMIVTEVFDFDTDSDDAQMEVKIKGGITNRTIKEPVVIPTDKSTLLVFFITVRKNN